jgi:hypothetical protein
MITVYWIPGYSRVDYFGPELVERMGKSHPNVAAARDALKQALTEMPDICARAGAPRIGWGRGRWTGVV